MLPLKFHQFFSSYTQPHNSSTIHVDFAMHSKYFWPFFLFLLIETSYGVSIASARQMGLQNSEDAPTHLNFFRAALRGRQRVLSCANDPNVCSDREKNPWGGDTCCFRRFCKDTLKDSDNCGGCGKACGYGLVCCDGKCVDVQNDPRHCGSCFEECPGKNTCAYAMCDYGGWLMMMMIDESIINSCKI